MRNTLLLPLVLAAVSLAGCHDPAAPDAAIAVPLALRVVPARTSITSGDTVTVRVTARNITRAPVTIASPWGCRLGVALEDASGQSHQAALFFERNCPANNTPV